MISTARSSGLPYRSKPSACFCCQRDCWSVEPLRQKSKVRQPQSISLRDASGISFSDLAFQSSAFDRFDGSSHSMPYNNWPRPFPTYRAVWKYLVLARFREAFAEFSNDLQDAPLLENRKQSSSSLRDSPAPPSRHRVAACRQERSSECTTGSRSRQATS